MTHSVIKGTPIAYRSITTVGATGITAADFKNAAGQEADCVIVTVETNVVRWRADGSSPAAAEGHVIAAGEERTFYGSALIRALKFIDTAAGAATVKYTTMKMTV